MEIGRADRIGMERAHVRAWPALRNTVIDGWLWRASGGGSQRANSVSTIDFTGTDPEETIDTIEARYRTEAMDPRFQLFDETNPRDLTARLQRRGYRQTEATLTLFKRPTQAPSIGVESSDRIWDEWRTVYLGQITENRRSINSLILERIAPPVQFFAARLDGQLAATALCVIEAGFAVVECVATETSLRRRGAGRMVMQALETWAAEQGALWLGLQVVETNTAALRLYEGLGFQTGAHNSFWMPGR